MFGPTMARMWDGMQLSGAFVFNLYDAKPNVGNGSVCSFVKYFSDLNCDILLYPVNGYLLHHHNFMAVEVFRS